jgi:hypothetical protein
MEDYITLPYYQGDEYPGGFYYVLIIAYNFKSNSFYYIYDNPNSEKDSLKHQIMNYVKSRLDNEKNNNRNTSNSTNTILYQHGRKTKILMGSCCSST